MSKVEDEWAAIIAYRDICGNCISIGAITIPGFASEQLAESASEKVSGALKSIFTNIKGVSVKVKERRNSSLVENCVAEMLKNEK
jgi:hypothetical protein